MQLLPVTSSYCQPLPPVTLSYCQLPSVTASYLQLLLVTSSYSQLPPVTSSITDRVSISACALRVTSSPGSLLPPDSLGTRLRHAYAIAALSTVHHVIKTIPRKDQAIKAFYLVRSSDQGPISTIKIFDPSRKRFHGRCVGDYPLIH